MSRLGKRKRSWPHEQQDQQVLDVFRAAFEKRFEPLDPVEPEEETESSESSVVSSDSWSGISDDEEEVPVITASLPLANKDEDKATFKQFMSSQPPSSTLAHKRQKSPESDPDENENENVRNDAALHNLLSGKTKLLESFKTEQTNVPMNIRQAIQKKRLSMEGKRRQSAHEAGIVLEREVRKRSDSKRRERGVGGPTVGKFRGGMLRLSSRDLHDIQGSRRRR